MRLNVIQFVNYRHMQLYDKTIFANNVEFGFGRIDLTSTSTQ